MPPLGGYLFQDEPGLPERNREINRPGTKFRQGLQMLGPPLGCPSEARTIPPSSQRPQKPRITAMARPIFP